MPQRSTANWSPLGTGAAGVPPCTHSSPLAGEVHLGLVERGGHGAAERPAAGAGRPRRGSGVSASVVTGEPAAVTDDMRALLLPAGAEREVDPGQRLAAALLLDERVDRLAGLVGAVAAGPARALAAVLAHLVGHDRRRRSAQPRAASVTW